MTIRLLIAALLFPCAALAQSRVTIPVQDPVYRDLDRLIALRLVEVGLYGQRPYSRREIARLTREAVATAQRREVSPATRRIVDRLARRFSDALALNGAPEPASRSAWRTEAVVASSPFRGIPNDSVGSVQARVNPLFDGHSGRRYVDGGTFALELGLEQRVAPAAWLHVRPRATVGDDDRSVSAVGSLEAASATFAIRNVTIEAGRQQVVWGQGMDGGLLTSASGRPLDAVRIATDLPFRGWFIKGRSPMRGSLVAATLGPNQTFPHSILVAYKLSGHPFSIERFELAASVLSIQGGRGSPRASTKDHLMDLIPALKYLLPDDGLQFSNKLAGWEYRLRFPELRGLQLYVEHAFDDMDPRRWKSTFWEDAGHIAGASLTDLGRNGELSATVEFHHTGLRFYQHSTFTSGVAFNGTLIGDPLGKQGNGLSLRMRRDAQRASWVLDLAHEQRDGDVIATTADNAQLDNFRFVRLERRPAEWRSRVVLTTQPSAFGRTQLRAGYERVTSFMSTSGNNRNNWLVGISFEGTLGAQRP